MVTKSDESAENVIKIGNVRRFQQIDAINRL
ncbi:hypothetical protein BBC0122_004480 [Bartonella choladocola]|uniref:Uncharacterized protein n=1 Tax=Bartonella choladocola TaxID=2750995 RepID=A0A1U9MFS9_9HYPH|nr:hypothetical protein BBC0122_004480 [Bartonella choladocola]